MSPCGHRMFDSPKRQKHQKRNKRNKRICQIAMRSIDDLSFEVIILRVDGGGSHGTMAVAWRMGWWVDGLEKYIPTHHYIH